MDGPPSRLSTTAGSGWPRLSVRFCVTVGAFEQEAFVNVLGADRHVLLGAKGITTPKYAYAIEEIAQIQDEMAEEEAERNLSLQRIRAEEDADAARLESGGAEAAGST